MYTPFWLKTKKIKTEKLTRKGITSQIEALLPGEKASYRLRENGNNQAMVEFNTAFPRSGKKYILRTQATGDTNRTGREDQLMESDEVREMANWLIEHKAKRRLERRIIPATNIRRRTKNQS